MPAFIRHTSGICLRPYQVPPIARLQESILNQYGDTIIIVFPRQSGKDEFLIQLMAYLLYFYSEFPLSMVAVNPTYKPQTVNAILRFDQVLSRNPLTTKHWRKHGDFMRLLDQSRISFLSGDSKSNVVGATASLLLIVNEAQDISPTLYQRKFIPMAASTNATRLLAGTLWTSTTLLSQEIRHARYSEKLDNRQRVFMVDADYVRTVLPNYGNHVDSVISRWGRQHPLVKTQYFNEEIDATAGMFNPARMALIFGSSVIATPSPAPSGSPESSHQGVAISSPSVEEQAPSPLGEGGGEVYPVRARLDVESSDLIGNLHAVPNSVIPSTGIFAFLLDLAGQDEAVMADPAARLANPSRDSATLSIVEIDNSTVPALNYPTYRVLHRVAWTGENHLTIFGQVKSLAENWNPRYLVIDATGVGEGLWALLDKAFPGKVIPVKFTSAVKSEIGYRFLAMVNTGRFKAREQSSATIAYPGVDTLSDRAWAPGPMTDYSSGRTPSQEEVEAQYRACQSEVLPGPGKTLRWGVPEGTRDPEGSLIHDDYVLADALVTQLDTLDWSLHSPTLIIDPAPFDPRRDYLQDEPDQGFNANTDLLSFIDHNF